MATNVVTHDEPSRWPSAGRLGALAGVTPIAMFAAWIWISGWGGPSGQFVIATAEIVFAAVIAGWIVGGHLGRSTPARLGGLVAYVFVAGLVLLPINVVGSTWEDLHAGRISDLVGIVGAAAGYLLYGAISAIYTTVYLLPFGAGWLAAFLVLRRTFDR